ncbi:MAG: InlB B-repeat-containing protein [Clostridiaceae bacterium]|nr:InlB B-repeat-containing protein [Clostridiaceae bacterium]
MQEKRLLSLLLVGCFILSMFPSSIIVYGASVPSDYGIRWKFDGNMSDHMGVVSLNDDYSAGNLQYNSTTHIEGSHGAYFDGNTFLYSWSSLDSLNGNYGLTSLGGTGSQITISSLVQISEDRNQPIWRFGNDWLHLVYDSASKKFNIGLWVEDLTVLDSTEVININEWYLVTYVIDGTIMRLYINGTLSNSTSLSSLFDSSLYPGDKWYMGVDTSGNRIFQGHLDDITVYGRALTSTEIQDMYHFYFPPQLSQYTVSFDVDGGSHVNSQIVEEGDFATIPIAPTKVGHTFEGWYTNNSYTTEFDFHNTSITEDGTIYGKWEINQYTVTFDSQGGSVVDVETVDYNDLIVEPEAPVKEGYSFGGWYREAGLINQWDFGTDVVTQNMDLYAKWNVNQYTVNFNVDGGSSVATQMVAYNDRAIEPIPPTKTGYTFEGWYTDNSYTTEFDFHNTSITGDTTIYAKWEINQYTVTFDSQGGSPVNSQVVDFNTVLVAPEAPVKEGYSFGGWYREAGLINQWNFGVDIATENRTLYAKWLTPQDSITMIASPNNVEFTESFNQIFTLNISNDTVIGSVYKSDMNLGGIFTDLSIGQVNNSETTVTAEVYGNLSSVGMGTITLNEDKLNNRTNPLSANITVASKPTYTVNFNVDGGSSVGNQTVEYNQKATRPLDPTKTGYTFDGWYTDNSFTTEFNFEETITTDTHIYARWVSYNANLSNLILSQGTLSPEFHYGITSYVANVANNVTNIKVTPTVADAGATIIANGYAVGSGQPSQAINLNVGENTVKVEVTAQDGSIKTYTVIVTRAESVAPSRNSSGSGGGGGSTPLSNNKEVITNNQDQVQKLGTETITEIGGKREIKLVADSQQINNLIEEYAKENQTNKEVSFSITNPGDITRVLLTGDIVKNLGENNFRVSVIEEQVEYHLEAQNFAIEKVAELMGVPSDSLHTIDIELNIDKTSSTEREMLKDQAKALGHEIVVEPVKFEIIARTSTDHGAVEEVEINRFNTYAQRIIEIPNDVDKNKITTGIVSNVNGSYSHIPTEIFQKDGKTYSRLNSLTNSSYSIIWNPVFIDEVKGHWSEAIVNGMASRLVLVDYQNFEADKAVTRAEFAEYIVRALGLYREGLTLENKFTDLDKNKHLTSILIANDWGLIHGYPDRTFKPDATITREEAMTMYAKAMDIAKILENSEDKLSSFVDSNEVADWATVYVRRAVDAGIFSGKGDGILDPKGTLTHAESLTAIRNLLIKAGLINN